ncbi:Alpha/beta hydrolase family-domain-containing protein [Crassisporium funariophilum]|nr:Alpha/beta hydrolase family-domain-containing protein [Crassisporium funariophilum]
MLSILLLALSASAAALVARGTPNCEQVTVSVDITANTAVIDVEPPRNQSELTGLVSQFTSETSNVTSQIHYGQAKLNAKYDIWSLLCLPPSGPTKTVEFAVHGINFDHTYWNFGGEASKYNYVDAALKAGHAIFIYDRLGVGRSSKPDGIKEVQLATEVEIAAALIKRLRSGDSGHTFQRIIGVGHSFGSVQLVGLAAQYGDLLDATVLTGFSPFTGSLDTALASFGLTIASQQNRARFGSLSNSYLATQSIINDQLNFFYYPFFDPEVLQKAEDTKATVTLGELLTQGASPALNYTRPLLVVTGDKDFIFCGGNCYQSLNGSTNLISATKILFPAVQNFDYFIPANTGHGINLHFSAPETFAQIEAWLARFK